MLNWVFQDFGKSCATISSIWNEEDQGSDEEYTLPPLFVLESDVTNGMLIVIQQINFFNY